MQSMRTWLGAALVASLVVAGSTGLSAQAKGLEINGFAGTYTPTTKDGRQGNLVAERRGSLAYGGRLSYWSGGLLGFEATGAFSPARVRVTGTGGSRVARSTKVLMGGGKLMFNLTPSTSRLGFAVGGGPAYIRTKSSVMVAGARSTAVGALGGIALRLNLGENVALRGDLEDYLYKDDFGLGKVTTHDLLLSGGLSLHF